jgi:hypothetical protein
MTTDCILSPPIDCTNKKNKEDDKMIGKFPVSPEEVSKYFMVADKLDPKGIFTPQVFGSCPVAKEKTPSGCGEIQIVLEKGVYDLTLPVPFIKIFKKLEPVFKGLVIMDQNKVLLNNITMQNIMYSMKNPKKTMFTNIKDLYAYDDIYKWTIVRKINDETKLNTPPDLFIINAFDNFYESKLAGDKDRFTILDFIDTNFDSSYKNIYQNSVYKSNVPNIFKELARRSFESEQDNENDPLWIRFSPKQRMKDSIPFFHMNPFRTDILNSRMLITEKMHADFLEVFLKQFAEKVSVYGMGITLLELVNQDFLHQIDSGVKEHPVFREVIQLIADMISPNPVGRITGKQALDAYYTISSRL